MQEITISDSLKITNNKSIFTLNFKYPSQSIINSLIKTRIINGASSNENYTIIKFKAESVKSFEKFQHDYKVKYGRKNLMVCYVANIIKSISEQLKYLIEKESKTILGYNPSNIIVINDITFAYIDSEFIANICETNNMATIYCPFSYKDFFLSNELLNVKEIPYKVHYKTSYFSFGLLIVYCLLADKEFYNDYLNHKNSIKLLEYLENTPIKDTKLYWLLSRCLDEDPNKRSIILI